MALFGWRREQKVSPEADTKLRGKATKLGKQAQINTDKKSAEVKDTSNKSVVKSKTTASVSPVKVGSYSNVLIKPRITEKATILAEEGGVYTFNVHPEATKKEIAKAIENNYKVKPIKVNIADIKSKKVRGRKGGVGVKAGGKKAMVYLKKGDKIEFV